MPTSLEILGKNISTRRKEKGLSQTQLADALHVEQGTVSAWERGKIDIPYSTLCRIAEKLQTSPAALSDPSRPIEGDIDKRRLDAIAAIAGAGTAELRGVWPSLSVIVGALESKKEKLGG